MDTSPNQGSKPASHAFQVNLEGVIELLSEHLYSGPHVYLRELLQNSVDAIAARRMLGKAPAGQITVELVEDASKDSATLVFEDNGVGLTEDEVHRFLATIGSSSKRGELACVRSDFIGQFGIGLLSGFMVSDEIVMVTRSAKAGGAVLEWRGRGDGTYSLRVLEKSEAQPGTTVFLRSKRGASDYFKADYIRHHLESFGEFLPHRIEFVHGDSRATLNGTPPPWEASDISPSAWRGACLNYGEKAFSQRFFDCFILSVPEAGIRGVAYVLPESPSLASRRADRVYLKRMLLSERADGLLPEWAFFVRCVINANALSPNASREAFQEDDALEVARNGLIKCLRDYLLDLARHDLERLGKLIDLHYRAFKMLAVDDDDFYKLFIDWLPFETSKGHLPLAKIRAGVEEVVYVPHIDIFRQLSAVASAQGLCLINAGYACDVDLITRLPEVFADLSVRRVGPGELLEAMEDVPAADRLRFERQLNHLNETLAPFDCDVVVRSFHPMELAALYSLDEQARFYRDVQRSKEQSSPLFQNLLDGLVQEESEDTRASLCLNWRNPLAQRLLALPCGEVLSRAGEMLYVQSLMQGFFPLGFAERQLLGTGLTRLLDLAMRARPES